MGKPVMRGTAVAMGLAVTLLAGCSSENGPETIRTIEPATAAVSPELTTPPAGTVRPLDQAVEAMVLDPASGESAALADDGNTLLLL
ncbi:hypothetical protein Q8814_25440, partial [Rhodococcus sp. CC-R104]|nr:hypothetical protein [Rhodococcus sp. CC-R104]